MPERWLPVTGYEGFYEVSDLGRVRSLTRSLVDRRGVIQHFPGRVLVATTAGQGGYPTVALYRNKVRRTVTVHLLVLETFRCERPDGLQTRHLNGIKTDNRLSNLAYGTALENAADKDAHGSHHPHRGKTHCAHGHPFSGENLRLRRNAAGQVIQRNCVACIKASWLKVYERTRA